MVRIVRAQPADLPDVAVLFDAYRCFYGQPSDRDGAEAFLAERMAHQQSVILLARGGDQALGFTQLYPSFSSVSMAPIVILNDLFVVAEGRGQGIATALLDAACCHARAAGAIRLSLSTAVDNHAAQALYEGAGWKRDTAFMEYSFSL